MDLIDALLEELLGLGENLAGFERMGGDEAAQFVRGEEADAGIGGIGSFLVDGSSPYGVSAFRMAAGWLDGGSDFRKKSRACGAFPSASFNRDGVCLPAGGERGDRS